LCGHFSQFIANYQFELHVMTGHHHDQFWGVKPILLVLF